MNAYEQTCFNALQKKGFEVLHRGWPDFFVLNKTWSRGFCLELKRKGDKVRPEQEQMHLALARFGIVTHVAREDWVEMLQKKGRCVLTPADYHGLKRRLQEVSAKIEELMEDRYVMLAEFEKLSILFDDPSEAQEQNRDLGIVKDSKHAEEAAENLRRRRSEREIRQALEKMPNLCIGETGCPQPPT